MGSIIGEWIANIAVITVLGALVDMILPNSSFRKYTGFLFGLAILVMILQPVLQFLNQAQNFDSSVSRNALVINTQRAAFQSSQLEEKQKRQLETVFKESLQKDLAFQLKRAVGLEKASVKITFHQNRGETDYSTIEWVEVTASSKEQTVFIKPVIIDSGQKLKTSSGIDAEKITEIKDFIANLYQIGKDRVLVNEKQTKE